MKIKRYKQVNRRLNYYINNFGFRQPYQLLIDGTFCFAALKNQVNIADNIPRYLHGELKLITTQCALIETEKLGAQVSGATVILKQYLLHKCGHEGKPIPAARCFQSMIIGNNPKHYIIATQDKELQQSLRQSVGVPVLYLVGRTPILGDISKASSDFIKQKQLGITNYEKEQIDQLKQENGLATEENIKKRKKKKGPNPLSCLKKKKPKNDGHIQKAKAVVSNKPFKNRKRVRIPQHVREAIFNNVSKLAAENK